MRAARLAGMSMTAFGRLPRAERIAWLVEVEHEHYPRTEGALIDIG